MEVQALPQDSIEEILLRLPVKSISRFKCVCRSWLDLIYDHNFVKKQINYAKTSHHHQFETAIVRRYLLPCQSHEYEIMVYDKCIGDNELSCPLSFHQLEIPQELVADQVGLTGYCDGMFCISVVATHRANDGVQVYQSVYLWNPIIHDLARLPPLAKRGVESHELATSPTNDLFAIGHNLSIDDYYICKIPMNESSPSNLVEIVYLKTSNSNWKSVGDQQQQQQPWPYKIDIWQRPISFNDNLYCLASRAAEDGSPTTILCFNGAKENFEELALPRNCGEWLLGLKTAFRGHSLCLITFSPSPSEGMQFWLHKDSSWSYFQNVPYPNWISQTPLCITSSCIYFVNSRDTTIMMYNFKDKSMKYTNWSASGFKCIREFDMVETIISPTRLISHVYAST